MKLKSNVFKCNLKELTTKNAHSTRGQRSVFWHLRNCAVFHSCGVGLAVHVASVSQRGREQFSSSYYWRFTLHRFFMPWSTLNSLTASLHWDDFMASFSGKTNTSLVATTSSPLPPIIILHLQSDPFPSVLSSTRSVASPTSCSHSDEWSDAFIDQLCSSVIPGCRVRFKCDEFPNSKLVHYVR